MKVAIYYARAEGAHPNASIELTEQCWPVMYRRIKSLGYELTLLTAKSERIYLPYDERIDFDVDPSLPIYSREVAWGHFLLSMDPQEEAAMVEPDCYLRRLIPPLRDDADMMLLHRDRPPTPSCFRLARRAAHVYYLAMANMIAGMPREKQKWWGDIDAQQALVKDSLNLPHEVLGVRIEHRDHRDYCMDDRRSNRDSVAWMYNGTKKRRMVILP